MAMCGHFVIMDRLNIFLFLEYMARDIKFFLFLKFKNRFCAVVFVCPEMLHTP